jgi:hypothetical protein
MSISYSVLLAINIASNAENMPMLMIKLILMGWGTKVESQTKNPKTAPKSLERKAPFKGRKVISFLFDSPSPFNTIISQDLYGLNESNKSYFSSIAREI